MQQMSPEKERIIMADSMFNCYWRKRVHNSVRSPEENKIFTAYQIWQRELKFGDKIKHPNKAFILEAEYRKLKRDREIRIKEYEKFKPKPAWPAFLFWSGVLSVLMNCVMYCSD